MGIGRRPSGGTGTVGSSGRTSGGDGGPRPALPGCVPVASGEAILDVMGFNPNRKRVARRTDIVFVAAAVIAVIALVAWTAFG